MPIKLKSKALIIIAAVVFNLISGFAALADSINYTYDDLNRLRKVDYGNGYVIEYDYDEVGNRWMSKIMLNPHTLTVQKAGIGAGVGVVTSSTIGIDCGTHCSDIFSQGTVTLTASTPASSTFSGWSGACTGTGVCVVNLNADTSVTATFLCPTSPIKIGSVYYSTVHDAYNAATDGAVIQSQNVTLVDSLIANYAKSVTLDGGYDACYSAKSGSTTLQGQITTNSGQLTVKDYILQP